MNLIIVRHGQTAWNEKRKTQGRTDIPLDEIGMRQARLIAERLQKRSITAVYTSPLLRAVQTAQRIAAPHRLMPIPHDALIEQSFGDWEGIALDELTDRFPKQIGDWWKDPFSSTPRNGESMQEVKDRLLPFLRTLIEEAAAEDTFCLVGHAVPLRLTISHLLGLPESKLHHFRLDNAAVTEFAISEERPVMLMCNDCSHLGASV